MTMYDSATCTIKDVLYSLVAIVHARHAHLCVLCSVYPYTTWTLVSEPNPLRPLQDLQYGLGEMVFGGCRHLEYVNIWCLNEPK